MAKGWFTTISGNEAVRRSHITSVAITEGKSEAIRGYEFFVVATARGRDFVIAGGFGTKTEATRWMKERFK